MTTSANAVSAFSADLDSFRPNVVRRYAPGDHDVTLKVLYCGYETTARRQHALARGRLVVSTNTAPLSPARRLRPRLTLAYRPLPSPRSVCHTDVHFVKELATSFPLTPGHEIVGVVTAVGAGVNPKKLRVGDNAAVGCLVDSCFGCRSCRRAEEQYCLNGNVFTYGGVTKYGRAGPDGAPTHGGYSDATVVNERFCFKLPPDADLAKCAPLLCAGITTYDPLVRYGCAPDAWRHSSDTGRKRVGVVGIGGLGQMAVKIAKSFQCEVVAMSTSPEKEQKARAIGADQFWLTTNEEFMRYRAELAKRPSERDAPVFKKQDPGPEAPQTPPEGLPTDPAPGDGHHGLDLILDTVSAPHDLGVFLDVLAPDGQLVILGLNTKPFDVASMSLVFSRKVVRGSLVGGTRRTEECLAYCVENGVYPEIEVVNAGEIGKVMRKLDEKNDSVVRYVVDCGTIPKASAATA